MFVMSMKTLSAYYILIKVQLQTAVDHSITKICNVHV